MFVISENTKIELKQWSFHSEIYVNDQLLSLPAPNFVSLLFYQLLIYLDCAKRDKISIFVNEDKVLLFLTKQDKIKNSVSMTNSPLKRFSFLLESPHFVSLTESKHSFVYSFKDTDMGEMQEILIQVPKEGRFPFVSSFSYLEKGDIYILKRNSYPDWFKTLSNQARNESRLHFRTERLFIQKNR